MPRAKTRRDRSEQLATLLGSLACPGLCLHGAGCAKVGIRKLVEQFEAEVQSVEELNASSTEILATRMLHAGETLVKAAKAALAEKKKRDRAAARQRWAALAEQVSASPRATRTGGPSDA